jgi:hypothetical protein
MDLEAMSLLQGQEHVNLWKFYLNFILLLPLAPLPPKIIILEPANTAECAYLGAGGVPDIFGFVNLFALTSRI